MRICVAYNFLSPEIEYDHMEKVKVFNKKFIDEEEEWLNLTPAQRMPETTKLWELYLALEGSLNPAIGDGSLAHYSLCIK